MIFNIPQFIDKEDKIVGPITAKQLGWMFGAGAILLVVWNLLDTTAFYMAAVPIVGITLAFAFYRPYNQSLASFIYFTFLFLFREKIYVWKRVQTKELPIKKAPAQKKPDQNLEARMNNQKIEEISKLLDTNIHPVK